MKNIVLVVLLLFSQLGHAEAPEWLLKAIKVDNPNQLGYWFNPGEDCPISREEGQEIAS